MTLNLNIKTVKKSYLFFFVAFFMLFVILGCNDEEGPETCSLTVATVMKNESRNYYLEMDNGKKILLKDSAVIHYYNSKESDRILASLCLLGEQAPGYDYVAKMYDLYKILVKPVVTLTPEMTDSIGNDKIDITEMWFSKHYLNIQFRYLASGAGIRHMINLVHSPSEGPLIDEQGYVRLDFLHNKMGDTPVKLHKGIASFEFYPPHLGYRGVKIRVNTLNKGYQLYTLDWTKGEEKPRLSGRSAHLTFQSDIQ